MCWVTEIGRERIYSAPSSSNASPSDTVRGEWRRTWPTKRKTREDFNFWGVPNVILIEKHVHVVKDTCKSWCFSKLFKPWYSKFIWVSKKPMSWGLWIYLNYHFIEQGNLFKISDDLGYFNKILIETGVGTLNWTHFNISMIFKILMFQTLKVYNILKLL